MNQPKKIKKIILILLIVWPLIFLTTHFLIWYPDKKYLIFCDVGQGDAILFLTRDFQMMIDTGPDNHQAERCLYNYLPFYDRQLEVLVLTHPDADHIGSAPQVVRHFSPQLILAPPVGKDSQVFRDLLEEISFQPDFIVNNFPDQHFFEINNDTSIYFYTNYDSESFLENPFKPETNSQILPAKNSSQPALKTTKSTDYNDLSIITFLNIEQINVLLTGDLEKNGELALIQRGVIDRANILKVGHHGSKSSSQPQFLAHLTPEQAVISAGSRNSYGHPASEVLDRLAAHHIEAFRTDRLGDIVYVFTNSQTWFSSGKNLNYFRILLSKIRVFD